MEPCAGCQMSSTSTEFQREKVSAVLSKAQCKDQQKSSAKKKKYIFDQQLSTMILIFSLMWFEKIIVKIIRNSQHHNFGSFFFVQN